MLLTSHIPGIASTWPLLQEAFDEGGENSLIVENFVDVDVSESTLVVLVLGHYDGCQDRQTSDQSNVRHASGCKSKSSLSTLTALTRGIGTNQRGGKYEAK